MKTIQNEETFQETRYFIKTHFDEVYYYVFEILCFCPIRKTELMNLKIDDLITGDDSWVKDYAAPSQFLLRGNEYFYFVPPNIVNSFSIYVNRLRLQHAQYLFCTKRGVRLQPTHFSRMLKNVSDSLGISNLSCRNMQLRASWANTSTLPNPSGKLDKNKDLDVFSVPDADATFQTILNGGVLNPIKQLGEDLSLTSDLLKDYGIYLKPADKDFLLDAYKRINVLSDEAIAYLKTLQNEDT